MSNSYFRFKEFIIEQDRCAMKVTTDACIQGAWTPVLPQVRRILDVGAGTGLLSLMMAQRSQEALIDAVELDEAAAAQAAENVAASAWAGRVVVCHEDVRQYATAHQYDLIISNPPFFNNSLLGPAAQKNNARHTVSLSYSELLGVFGRHLAAGGYVSVLLPAPEHKVWADLAMAGGWQCAGTLAVRHNPTGAVNRMVSLWSRDSIAICGEEELIIRDGGNAYTAEFSQLLQPYYLFL